MGSRLINGDFPPKERQNKMTYSSSLAAGRSQFSSRSGRNTVSFQAQERVMGPISNTIILIVLACLLGLLYLTQVTKPMPTALLLTICSSRLRF